MLPVLKHRSRTGNISGPSPLSRLSLQETISNLKESGTRGLSLFVTAGYPTVRESIDIIKFIDREKLADFVEVGIPFSDPLADGVTIQKTSSQAIRKGADLKKILNEIKENEIKIPLVLMTYLNPLIAAGIDKSLAKAAEAGFSAVIVPDLPLEESGEVYMAVKKTGMGLVFLASPSTPMRRISEISLKSAPFLYYVSSFGVTGAREKLARDISEKLSAVKRYSAVPVYCGFGISNPAQAGIVGRYADGIIIGSALLKLIKGKKPSYFKQIRKFAISIKKGLGNAED
jgi:tryptophan synthase alpha chain